MNNLSDNKNSLKDLLNTSWEIWDYLREKAGLDVKTYDLQIVEELCTQMGIPLPCKDIKRELQNRNISPELFIGAFFKAIQPYAQMMTDLCVFFYLYGIKRTKEEMKILFDFGKGVEDLGFDLKHFREILWKYRRISDYVAIYGWNHETLWDLAGIFREFWQYSCQDPKADDWLRNYEEKGKFNLPLPILPITGIQEIDLWLQRVWQVWTTIVLECRKHGPNRDDLRKHAEVEQKVFPELVKEEREESYESIVRFKELSSFKDWDAKTLFHLDHDRWPGSMFRGLFGFTEQLLKISEDKRIKEAQSLIQKVQELFSDLFYWEGERETFIKEFFELLNLPIWNRRHELYQTWVLTQVDKALSNYQRTIYHVNGALILKFSGTHIGTVETEKGRIHIWSELRSPLANPVGEGRKGHIQPDYSLTFEPVTAPSQTVVAIECKQYRKANPQNFADALIDYARGRPNAKVLLVNYSDIPEKILDRIDNNLKARTLTVGNFRPDKLQEMEIFKHIVLEALPKAIVKKEVRESLKERQFDLIAVDISGSMENILGGENVLKILQMIIDFSPSAKLLAIDTVMKKEWANAGAGLQELLALPRNGGTDLPKALSNYDLERAVILTDNDGWMELNNIDNLPSLVIEIGSEKEVKRTISIPEIWPEKETTVEIKIAVGSEKTLYFHFRE
jgi:hypothetical protein